ncbi:hypothetical protein V8B97DRAFT_1991549 [Scleroderma yunnanense]
MIDGYEWLWADTCCIDERRSTELSEAISSSYRWYENSGYAMRTSTMFFPLCMTWGHIPIPTVIQSGSRVDGPYRR